MVDIKRVVDQKIESITKELVKIHAEETLIGKRIWDKGTLAKDINGTELTKETIKKRVNELADQIIREFPDANPVLVGVMDGANLFLNLLKKALKKQGYTFTSTFIRASSYGTGTESGELTITGQSNLLFGGKTVFVVDDILDTSKTMTALIKHFLSLGAQDAHSVVLIDKVPDDPAKRVGRPAPTYAAFELHGDPYVVGFGLDALGSELREEDCVKVVDKASLPTADEEYRLIKVQTRLNQQLQALIKTRDILAETPIAVSSQEIASVSASTVLQPLEVVETVNKPLSLSVSLGGFIEEVSYNQRELEEVTMATTPMAVENVVSFGL